MRFKIHNRENGDSLVIEGNNLDECREQAKIEESKRFWKVEDCWSEELKNNGG